MKIKDIHKKFSKEKSIHSIIKGPIVLGSSWLFQGLLYMDMAEKLFRIFMEIIIIIILFIILNYKIDYLYMSLLISIICAHTINWILNGQIPVALRNSGLLKTRGSSIYYYSDCIKIKINNSSSIKYAAFFGSLARNEIQEDESDLDIRIVRYPGFINALKASTFIMSERFLALIKMFPLDIYLLDDMKKINDMREPPIEIKNYEENKGG